VYRFEFILILKSLNVRSVGGASATTFLMTNFFGKFEFRNVRLPQNGQAYTCEYSGRKICLHIKREVFFLRTYRRFS